MAGASTKEHWQKDSTGGKRKSDKEHKEGACLDKWHNMLSYQDCPPKDNVLPSTCKADILVFWLSAEWGTEKLVLGNKLGTRGAVLTGIRETKRRRRSGFIPCPS